MFRIFDFKYLKMVHLAERLININIYLDALDYHFRIEEVLGKL